MKWNVSSKNLLLYAVKVEFQAVTGTGFSCLFNGDKSFAAIATARHVLVKDVSNRNTSLSESPPKSELLGNPPHFRYTSRLPILSWPRLSGSAGKLCHESNYR